MFNFFKNVVRRCDFFGSPIELMHMQDDQIRTVVGGLGSLILIFTFFGVFNNNILGFFRLDFIDYSSKDAASIDLALNLTHNQTMFAIGLSAYNLAKKKDLFTLKLKQTIRYDNGTTIKPPAI